MDPEAQAAFSIGAFDDSQKLFGATAVGGENSFDYVENPCSDSEEEEAKEAPALLKKLLPFL